MTTSPRWRVALASAASVAMLGAAPLAGAQAAHAQPYPPTQTVNITQTIAAGQAVPFSTPRLFRRHQAVTAILESRPITLGRFRADDNGALSGTITIPTRATSGWHVLRLVADRPDVSVGVTIWVVGGVSSTGPNNPPGGQNGHGHGRHGTQGRDAAGGTVSYRHQNQQEDRNRNRMSLAKTGDDETLALGGTAAALLVAGGGTLLAVRRRRSS